MKNLLAILFSLTAFAFFTGCDNDEFTEDPPYDNPASSLTWHFKGPVKVVQPDGSTYTHPDVITRIVFNSTYDMCAMYVYDVSFAGNMPIQINMEVYGLAVETVEGGYKIKGDGVVPKMGTREFEAYTIYGFEATVTTTALTYKMTCGDGIEYNAYPVTYDSKGYELQPGDIDENTTGPGTGSGIGGGTFTGQMAVAGQSDGSVYLQDGTWFAITFDDEHKSTATLVMYDVKFSDRMPEPLDKMIVEGIKCVLTPQGYRLSGDGIVPVWNSIGVDRYTVNNLTGLLTSETLTLSMDCGDYPLTYSGEAGDKPEDNDEDDDEDDETETTAGIFEGKMEVSSNGAVYAQEGIRFEITFNDESHTTATLVMYDVSFSPKMPFPLDEMYVENIICVETPQGYSLAGDGIIPIYNGKPFDTYTVTGLTGLMGNGILNLEMACGDYPLTYSGEIVNQ